MNGEDKDPSRRGDFSYEFEAILKKHVNAKRKDETSSNQEFDEPSYINNYYIGCNNHNHWDNSENYNQRYPPHPGHLHPYLDDLTHPRGMSN